MAALLSPAARWGALAALLAALALGWLAERGWRQAAETRAEAAEARAAALSLDLEHRSTRDAIEREVERLPGPDAAGELRRDWRRPD